MVPWSTDIYKAQLTTGSGFSYNNASWYDSTATTSAVSYNLQTHGIAYGSSVRISAGHAYDLPDGAKLIVDGDGNYRIDDKDSKVTYAANNNRQFSPHLNASDMLAEFVKFASKAGVKKEDLMGLPVSLFLSWLIIEAAERDGDKVEDRIDKQLSIAVRPRCLECGRFIRRLYQRSQFPFCSPSHGAKYCLHLSS